MSRCTIGLVVVAALGSDLQQVARAQKMYWAVSGLSSSRNGRIQQANLDGTEAQTVVDGLSRLNGIALDRNERKVYWVEHGDDKIQRASFDGSNVEDIVTSGLSYPFAIAVDAVAGKIYWTDVGGPSPVDIKRANLDGSDVENLIDVAGGVWGVALDAAAGRMYWANSGEGKIQRANLEIPKGQTMETRTDIEDLVTGLDGLIDDIALDLSAGKMYWLRYGSGSGVIERANLDGTNVEQVHEGFGHGEGIALDPLAGQIYWTDHSRQRIRRVDMDGSTSEQLVVQNNLRGIALDLTCEAGGADCQPNGVPDSCDLARRISVDCTGNDVPDECDGAVLDCNTNQVPDACDVAGGGIIQDVDFEGGLPAGWTTTGSFQITSACRVDPACDGDMWAYVGDTDSCDPAFFPESELISPSVALGPGRSELRYCSLLAAGVGRVLVDGYAVLTEWAGSPVWEERIIDLTPHRGKTVTFTFLHANAFEPVAVAWQLDRIQVISGSADRDSNGIPDECDPDFDGDGVIDAFDSDIDDDGYDNDVDVCDFTVPGTPTGSSGEPFGDWDLDCDVELDDYAVFEICLSLSGPDEAPPFKECLASFDADLDGDVDLNDVRVFQLTFGARQ